MNKIRSAFIVLLSLGMLFCVTMMLRAAPKETGEPPTKQRQPTTRSSPNATGVSVKKITGNKMAKLSTGYHFVQTGANRAVVYQNARAAVTSVSVECVCQSKGGCELKTTDPTAAFCKATAAGCSDCWMKATVPDKAMFANLIRFEAFIQP